jgi:hypothetical protein
MGYNIKSRWNFKIFIGVFDMKKIIIFSFLCIIILFCGCLNNGNNSSNTPMAKAKNLELKISVPNNEINITDSSIMISIILINIEEYSIKVSSYFDLTCNIFLNITTPNGSKLNYSDLFASPLEEYMIMNPNEKIEKSFDLKKINWKLKNENFNWTLNGKYIVVAEYGGIYPHIFSNKIEFELI